MRTVIIAVGLAGLGLTACSLYLSDHPTQLSGPDAVTSSDGGTWDLDAPVLDGGLPSDGGHHPGDGGHHYPDAPMGSDGGYPYPDAPDGGFPSPDAPGQPPCLDAGPPPSIDAPLDAVCCNGPDAPKPPY